MSQPLPPRFEDLLSRYLDSTLAPAEQAELAELLKDALLEKTFLEATRLGRDIAGVLSKPISDDEMTALVDADIHSEEGSKIAPGKDTRRISAILDRIDRDRDSESPPENQSPKPEAQIPARRSPPSTRRSRLAMPRSSSSSWIFGLAAAGVLIAVILFLVLSPSESDPAAAERTRESQARASKEAEARRQSERERMYRERALAESEATRRYAEARLEEIRRKQEELARSAAQPDQAPAEQEKRKAEEKRLAGDKERIEQELREAAELAKRTQRPAPAEPHQEEKILSTQGTPPVSSQGTTQAALAHVEEVAGEAFLVMKDGKSLVTAGAYLLPGQGLLTGGGTSRIVLRFPDKTRVDLGPETLLAEVKNDLGKRLALTRGTIQAVVAKQPKDQPMIFTTPLGQAKVVGTTLRLYVDPDPKKGTRLEVEEGKVELKNLAGKTVYVESGHYAVAAAGVEMVARKLESIPAPGPAWILEFQDDFTMAKPDRSLWGVNRGFYCMGSSPGVPEKQTYVDKAVECKGGSAVIHADRKGAAADSEWTSGYLGMNRNHARLYGRFEVCCKLPRGKGLQSWFCLVPDYPDPPCIALLTCSGDSPTSGVGMVRWDGTELGRKFVPVGGVDFSDGFHVVACEWESGSVKWYVDGELKESVSEHVPQKPLALMITLTVGAWAGLPDASTPSSAALEIKYVRVFKKK